MTAVNEEDTLNCDCNEIRSGNGFSRITAYGQPAPRTVYVLPMAGGLDQFLPSGLRTTT